MTQRFLTLRSCFQRLLLPGAVLLFFGPFMACVSADVVLRQSRNDFSISASGAVKDPKNKVSRWAPQKAVDGRADTAWCPEKTGETRGEWIQLDFRRETELRRIGITVGNGNTGAVFRYDARPRVLTLVLSDGRTQVLNLKDHPRQQLFSVPGQKTTSLRLVIEEVYPGNRFPHTCLNEITVFCRE